AAGGVRAGVIGVVGVVGRLAVRLLLRRLLHGPLLVPALRVLLLGVLLLGVALLRVRGLLPGGVGVLPAALLGVVLLRVLLPLLVPLALVVRIAEERVLGVPRFGAGAPAIVSH